MVYETPIAVAVPDVESVTISWGDGSADTTISGLAPGQEFVRSHAYPDQTATYNVHATATDDDGGSGSADCATQTYVLNMTIHDGQTDYEVPNNEEETVGAFTVANMNDTDGDRTPDNKDSSVKAYTDAQGKVRGENEVDLMRLTIDRPPNYTPGTAVNIIIRHGKDYVRFWHEPTKEQEYQLDSWSQDHIDVGFSDGENSKDIWVEGQLWSLWVRDIVIEMKYQNAKPDTVKATAVWAIDPQFRADRYLIDKSLTPQQIRAAPPWNQITPGSGVDNIITNLGGVGLRDPINGLGVKNVMLQAWTVLPLGVQDEPRVRFDLTRRKEAMQQLAPPNGGWQIANMETGHPTFHFPDLLDEANDDKQQDDEEGPNTNSNMFVVDTPGIQVTALGGNWRAYQYYGNFEEYVRVTIDGNQAQGDGRKGSRASYKFNWHSVEYLYADSAGNLARAATGNDIGEKHIKIPFPPGF